MDIVISRGLIQNDGFRLWRQTAKDDNVGRPTTNGGSVVRHRRRRRHGRRQTKAVD